MQSSSAARRCGRAPAASCAVSGRGPSNPVDPPGYLLIPALGSLACVRHLATVLPALFTDSIFA
jgi:hypothetical protein